MAFMTFQRVLRGHPIVIIIIKRSLRQSASPEAGRSSVVWRHGALISKGNAGNQPIGHVGYSEYSLVGIFAGSEFFLLLFSAWLDMSSIGCELWEWRWMYVHAG
jgi:hypothetical protein